MGEVIKVDFGSVKNRPRQEKVDAEKKPEKPVRVINLPHRMEAETALKEEDMRRRENARLLAPYLDQARKIDKYLRELPVRVPISSLALLARRAERYPHQELVRIIHDAGVHDLRRRPRYYRAVVEEFWRRANELFNIANKDDMRKE
ncbi:hypothetical protein HY504_01285 [Candidatus Wolfebacteria bacterium]|nr:hypothetical protein [Candidatus Wolfebacteria bacterium]